MSVKHSLPTAPVAGPSSELDALRAELRCILQHPAISSERRAAARSHLARCLEAARLRQWLALAVAECGRWEDQALAAEGNNVTG